MASSSSFLTRARGAVAAAGEKLKEAQPALEATMSDVRTRAAALAQSANARAGKGVSEASSIYEALRASDVVSNVANTALRGLDEAKARFGSLVHRPPVEARTSELAGEPDNDQARIMKAINKLSQRDKVGVVAEGATVAVGIAAGGAAAGGAAAVFGATTLWGSSALAASWLGGVFVVSTPVGWVIGSAALAGAAGFGLARLVRDGANQDRQRQELVERLVKRLEKVGMTQTGPSALAELGQLVAVCIVAGLLTDEEGQQTVSLVEAGKLNPHVAVARLKMMAMEAGVIEKTT